jgi:hypothetical protein
MSAIPEDAPLDDDEAEPTAPPSAATADPIEHFWGAAHEFLSAMRTLLDAADAYVEEQRRPRPATEHRLHRIDIE